MNEQPDNRHRRRVDAPADAFLLRMDKLAGQGAQAGHERSLTSVHSRLALIHQVAKEYATAAVKTATNPNPLVEIDELTDPPLYGIPTADDVVIITFRYTE